MSWLERLTDGFKKTADRLGDNLSGLATKTALDTSTLDDIEEALIASDLGPEASRRIREQESRIAQARSSPRSHSTPTSALHPSGTRPHSPRS